MTLKEGIDKQLKYCSHAGFIVLFSYNFIFSFCQFSNIWLWLLTVVYSYIHKQLLITTELELHAIISSQAGLTQS